MIYIFMAVKIEFILSRLEKGKVLSALIFL